MTLTVIGTCSALVIRKEMSRFFPLLRKFVDENQLFDDRDRILLAVSGGADSTAMAHLFKHGGYRFGIAHCNFSLRGEDSMGDAIFVEEMANSFGVPFYSITFDTIGYCREKNISIEMGARALRYEWFDTIMKEEGYQYLATAHHKDDVIETFLLNFTRGMGINGVHGIPVKNGHIVRPMLGFFRSEIEEYLSIYGIEYRTDYTNKSNDHDRNKIRNQIIPLFEEIKREFKHNAIRNIDNLKEARCVYRKRIDYVLPQLWIGENKISIPKLLELESPRSYMYEMLSPYGFNSESINSIVKSLTGLSGKQFLSSTHRVVKDRDVLIIESRKLKIEDDIVNVVVDNCGLKIENGHNLCFTVIESSECPTLYSKLDDEVLIDLDKLKGDLNVRHWRVGDYFCPFGMNGKRKKVSDFFTDKKFSLIDKELCNILCDGDQIVWIIGHRLDERYKITDKTKRILKINIK